MFSKPFAIGVLAVGCVTAAAGGAYLAVRQSAEPPDATLAAQPATVSTPAAGPTAVAETEALVTPSHATSPAAAGAEPEPVEAERPAPPPRRVVRAPKPAPARPAAARSAGSAPERPIVEAQPQTQRTDVPAGPPQAQEPLEVARPEPLPPAPPSRQFEELVVPASSVIGLQVDTSLTSERARVEDRVEARVTRDVIVDGRTAIPAGARVRGTVSLVDRGGKVRERARLGVRFHTLVLEDGTEVAMATEAIFREGDSPTGESARKIGGAAVGGAILGAIIGGKKGAVVGGATGAAGGTAAVMAGGRNAATLPAGTIVTVRLSEPLAIEVEKR